MGDGIMITCSSCKNKQSFTLGVGMAYSSLENVFDRVQKDQKEEIRVILTNHTVLKTGYEHRLYGCKKCHRLYEKFFVEIMYDDNKKYVTKFHCTNCKEPLERVSMKKAASYPCHKCGQKTLLIKQDILWD